MIGSSNFGRILSSLRVHFKLKADIAEKFAGEIEDEVVIHLKKFLRSQKREGESINSKWTSGNELYESKKHSLNEIKTAYLATFKNIGKEISNYDENYNALLNDYKQELNDRIHQLYTAFKELEEKYLIAFRDTKEQQTAYMSEIENALNSYRKMDKERLNKINERLLLFFQKSMTLAMSAKEVAEKNLFSKLPFNSAEAQQALKRLLTESDIMEDIPTVQLIECNEEIFNKLEYADLTCKTATADRLTAVDLKGEESIPSIFRTVLIKAWNVGEVGAELEKFNTCIKDSRERQKFCEVINIFRRKGNFTIPNIGYFPVANLFKIVLDETNYVNDVSSSMKILLYSQTYYSLFHARHKTHKIYLQEEIQAHPIWARKDFWELAIRKDIEEENRLRDSSEESDAAAKNGIYCRLGALGHNMKHLGMSQETVDELIIGTAEKCALPENLVEDLKVVSIRDQ